ncbi:MAG: RDD family protein [Promethearchaeota archaeon]|nr:MAG: RDD family protein [Candidatus Lokiarchaeota archaeon]
MPDTKPMIRKNKPSDIEFAEIGWRILAWIIDFVIILLITWLLMILFFWRTEIPFAFVFQILAYLIGLFYFSLLESINGQTLGKLIVGLRTVDEDTFEVSSFTENLKNCILKCHWFPCIIDLIIGIFKNSEDMEKKLRIMQNFSNTCVIRT